MNTIRKCVFTGVFALSAAFAGALDNTVSNDFWVTWAYVNPAPSCQTATAAGALEVWQPFVVVSDVLLVLDSSPLGLSVFIR